MKERLGLGFMIRVYWCLRAIKEAAFYNIFSMLEICRPRVGIMQWLDGAGIMRA